MLSQAILAVALLITPALAGWAGTTTGSIVTTAHSPLMAVQWPKDVVSGLAAAMPRGTEIVYDNDICLWHRQRCGIDSGGEPFDDCPTPDSHLALVFVSEVGKWIRQLTQVRGDRLTAGYLTLVGSNGNGADGASVTDNNQEERGERRSPAKLACRADPDR
jgi:hypothetical protein